MSDGSMSRQEAGKLLDGYSEILQRVNRDTRLAPSEEDLLMEIIECSDSLSQYLYRGVALVFRVVEHPDEMEAGMSVLLKDDREAPRKKIDEVGTTGIHLEGGSFISFDLLTDSEMVVAEVKEYDPDP